MQLEGKVAVITGASRGIGAAIATRLAAEGARVVVSANEERVREVAEAIGEGARAVVADVTRKADVVRLYDAAEEAFGRVDISVQNAGIITIARIEDMTEEEWDRVMAVNTKGCSCAARKRLRASASTARAGG